MKVRRIDNQLRGRSGRQGDPGVTQFYLSMEDELMRRFGSDNMKNMMSKLGMDDTQPIQSKMVSKAVESAQKRVEGNNFDARKRLLEYDDVLRQQREIIYTQRNEVLESENLRSIVETMITSSVERNVVAHVAGDPEQVDYQSLLDYINGNLLHEGEIKLEDVSGKGADEITDIVMGKVKEHYNAKEEQLSEEQMREFEKVVVLRAVDSKWMDHIDVMDQLTPRNSFTCLWTN